MTAWKTERCSQQPPETEMVSGDTMIQRKNIRAVENEATGNIEAYTDYVCESRFITVSEYEMLKSMEEIETDKAVNAAIDDYTLQLMEGGLL